MAGSSSSRVATSIWNPVATGMLMGLTDELTPGDEVSLTLTFDDGTTQDLVLPVKAFTEEEPHYHESDGADEDMDEGMDMEESP